MYIRASCLEFGSLPDEPISRLARVSNAGHTSRLLAHDRSIRRVNSFSEIQKAIGEKLEVAGLNG